MKLDLSKIKTLLGELYRTVRSSDSREPLLRSADFIWKLTLAILGLLFLGAILFDAFIFFFRVQVSENSQDVDSSLVEKTFNTRQLTAAKDILQKRLDAVEKSGENLPDKNPFK